MPRLRREVLRCCRTVEALKTKNAVHAAHGPTITGGSIHVVRQCHIAEWLAFLATKEHVRVGFAADFRYRM